MDRTERFYKIDQLLQGGRTASFARLMVSLGVSRAQLKRDLAYLRDRLNAPIEYDRDANGYRYGEPRSGPRFALPGLWFSAAEIEALLTMQQLLENLQPGLLTPHVKPLLARFRAILGSGDHSHEEVARRVRVLHLAARELRNEQFGAVAQATLKRRRLRIRHYNRMADRHTEHTISPQRLVHYRDNWYVDAWCHLREDLRSFAVDAIGAAELLAERAKEVPKAELDGYLKIPYADDRELLMDILRYGPDVEVLQPPALRRRVAEQLAAALKKY